jgi:hypothetical protein
MESAYCPADGFLTGKPGGTSTSDLDWPGLLSRTFALEVFACVRARRVHEDDRICSASRTTEAA